MLRSIVKQSGESVESVLEKKKKAIVGRICNSVPCDRLGDFVSFQAHVKLVYRVVYRIEIKA